MRRQHLEQNDGFTSQTSYEARNFRESRPYTILDGHLQVCAHGNTSWAESRYDNTWIADPDETHQFLYNHQGILDASGVIVTKMPRPHRTAPPEPVTGPAPEFPQVDGANSARAREANRSFLSNPAPARQVLLAADMTLAAVGVWAGFYWEPQLWRTKVKPAARRIRNKFTRWGDRDTSED